MQPSLSHQYLTLARYATWSNARLYATISELMTDEYRETEPAEVDALLGLLNQLQVIGRLWLARLRGYDPGIDSMHERAHDELASLREAQVADDLELCDYVHGLGEEDLLRPIPYRMFDGSAHTNSQQELLLELFVHQHHLRGRVCELLHRINASAPELDYLQFERESGA